MDCAWWLERPDEDWWDVGGIPAVWFVRCCWWFLIGGTTDDFCRWVTSFNPADWVSCRFTGWWLTTTGWVSGLVYTVMRCRSPEECWEVVA